MKVYCKYHSSTLTKGSRIEVCEVISTKTTFIPVIHLEYGPKSSLFVKASKKVLGNFTHHKFTHISENECYIESFD